MKNGIAFLAVIISAINSLFAQDARLTQYDKLPFIISPSLIGNFDGSSRIIGYYNYATDDNLSNNVFNLSADFKTKKKSLSIGFNYMKTGSENFAVSGDYFGLGISKSISIDKNHLHKFKIGSEITFLNPVYAKSKKGYNAYLDPRAFPFTKTSRIPDSVKYSNQYWGLNMGGSYTYNFNRICFEANASMYNLLWFTQKKDVARKRRRLMTNLSFKYAINKYSNLKFEQLTWQEGHFFDSDQEIIAADSIGIKDVIYGFMYENSDKRPYNFGLRSRSIKSFSLIFGIQILKNISTQLSYELPLTKDLDNPTQFGISFTYVDKKKKKSVELPAVASFGDSVFLNENDFTKVVNVHDTIFVYKNDTVLVFTNHEAENENVAQNNSDIKNDVVQKPDIKNEAVLIDSIRTSANSDLSKAYQDNNEIEYKGMIDSTKSVNHDSAIVVHHAQPDNHANTKAQETISGIAVKENNQQQIESSNKNLNDQTGLNKIQKDSSKTSIVNVVNKLTIEKREMTNVYFEFNKSSLSDSSKIVIDQFLLNQQIKVGVKLLVEGFCDDIGTDSHNLKLSKSRALAVKNYLLSKGVNEKIISVIHFGKTNKNLSDSDRWKYRKSVIVLID